jgi:hypothetical protein
MARDATDPGFLRVVDRAEFIDHREDVERRFKDLPSKFLTLAKAIGLCAGVLGGVYLVTRDAVSDAKETANTMKAEAAKGLEEVKTDVKNLREDFTRQQHRIEDKLDQALDPRRRNR